ncbi:uridylate kinase Ura6 [Drepanopeziza brunnea f. sp. 'multigermtubi' MB_m1]|uniref:Uridylate kinase Ura6 n=1 Tax=Marssonina brunnea f. sp. multigermtubi (strain MB_m1) TaxID=1072389 RepID=K1X0K3_MARBU|nr:uridylate kinase Ura6 [Drepanopeziza brunnea f. sp. 'multigermtubi' MB_m1]EKD18676.1 uridylate kinase Ura6 [Drepanopeziza brunnea f. sp. 'multigermtubi' MB_m1]
MDQHEIVSPVPFMLLLETLKHLPRTGWVQHGVDCPESVSGHIFLMTVMASLLKSDGDPSRRAAMALVHDMAESLVGDITPSQGVSKANEMKSCGKWRDDEMFEDQVSKVRSGACQPWKDALVQARKTFWEKRDLYSEVIFLIGPPGSGKITQYSRLALEFGICHISAGDLLRQEMAREGSEYAELISDHMKSKPPQPVPPRLVAICWSGELGRYQHQDRNSASSSTGSQGTIARPTNFRGCFNTIFLDCDVDVLIKRMHNRGASSNRLDDDPDVIKGRVEAFKQQNSPVEQHLRDCSPFFGIDCNGSEDEVYEKLKTCFEQIRGTK